MNWYEMLDWDAIGEEGWRGVSPSVKKKVRELGLAPKFDKCECWILMNPSRNEFECENCGGQFMLIKSPENCDVIYCPFCGMEGTKEAGF